MARKRDGVKDRQEDLAGEQSLKNLIHADSPAPAVSDTPA
jgi:hypothetical protein